MAELDNLRQASLYINNQLLSRGLLRDGQTIDFTDPGETSGEIAATMGRVIAVVNDLILRRDVRTPLALSLSTQDSKLTDPATSVTPSTANRSRPPFAPCAPSRSGKPTTSSGYRRRIQRPSARLGSARQPKFP